MIIRLSHCETTKIKRLYFRILLFFDGKRFCNFKWFLGWRKRPPLEDEILPSENNAFSEEAAEMLYAVADGICLKKL